MFQSLADDQRAHADLTFCSWERGWRSLLLRRYVGHAEVEEAVIPPVPEQTIVLVTRGEAVIESGAEGRWRSARYVPGSIAMTAPNRSTRLRWRTVSPDPHESLQLHLPTGTTSRVVEELWDRDPAKVDLPDTLMTTDPVLEQVMLDLYRAAEEGVPDLYPAAAVEFITVHTLVRHGALPPTQAVRRDDARIRRARSFIRENLHLPLTLAEIAEVAGMSRYHFLRLFRSQVGETPHRYLTRLRLECAQGELERTTATVAEIAIGCGFVSPSHFASAFRRQTGYTPVAYRRLHAPTAR